MRVLDYMTKEVSSVTADTRLTDVVTLMEDHDYQRIPVVDEQNRYLGLITEAIIANNSPSTASSLSIYEINYLLDKQTAGDLMTKEAATVHPDMKIEAAAAFMHDHGYSVLTAVDEQNTVVGIITDKDIFEALIVLTGYREEGARLEVLVEDKVGVLHDISGILAGMGVGISHLFVPERDGIKSTLIIQTDQLNSSEMIRVLENKGYDVRLIED